MRGILFDLDGTLLDIDLSSFLRDYFTALGPVVAGVTGLESDVERALSAVQEATAAMLDPHPGHTNRDVFNARFEQVTGADLSSAEEILDRFYSEVFPALGTGHPPCPGAADAVRIALESGYRVAIATNPIFPAAAIHHRMAWAGVSELPVHVITSYENMHACKPRPEYFLETATMLGCAPDECLMVGDDRVLDMAAADVGMQTYYVGGLPEPEADYIGDLRALIELLPRFASEA